MIEGNHPLQLLPTYEKQDFEKKRKCIKRIKLKLKKHIFDSKQRGDFKEAEITEEILKHL